MFTSQSHSTKTIPEIHQITTRHSSCWHKTYEVLRGSRNPCIHTVYVHQCTLEGRTTLESFALSTTQPCGRKMEQGLGSASRIGVRSTGIGSRIMIWVKKFILAPLFLNCRAQTVELRGSGHLFFVAIFSTLTCQILHRQRQMQ